MSYILIHTSLVALDLKVTLGTSRESNKNYSKHEMEKTCKVDLFRTLGFEKKINEPIFQLLVAILNRS